MKTRYGFVSNSSSSSFIIAFKGDENAMRNKLRSIFGVHQSKNYPIKSMSSMGDVVADHVDDSINTLKEWDDLYRDLDNPMEEHIRFIQHLKEGWKVYYGGFPDIGDELSKLLCDSDIDYEDDEIIIWQEGGY